jgi:exopolyphosphatase/guanosine-5'-triphosphate,3'-diphosphate pyrophosphatase
MEKKIKELEKKMEELSPDAPHSLQVRKLSFSIFDQLQECHQLDSYARFLLGGACLLHDLGLATSLIKHHKISQKMINEISFNYLDEHERALIAVIARYHRKAHPSREHKGFSNFKNKERDMISKLSAIIRVADGLDRAHANSVENIKIKKDGIWRFILKGKGEGTSEIDLYGFNKKKGLLEEVFDCSAEAIWESDLGEEETNTEKKEIKKEEQEENKKGKRCPHLQSAEFGEIIIDGKSLKKDIYIHANGKIEKRNKKIAKNRFGTSHKISAEELKEICKEKPEILIIGSGYNGAVELIEEAKDFLKEEKIDFEVLPTPEAVNLYNKTDKKKSALIHVTC